MIHAQDISKMLSEQVEAVAMYLLPKGRKQGKEWVAGSVSGEKGDSMKVCLAGSKAGVWCDFAIGNQYAGDLLDLWGFVKCCNFVESLSQAKKYLGIVDDNPCFTTPKEKKFVRPEKPKGRAVCGEQQEYLSKIRFIPPAVLSKFKIAVNAHGEIIFPILKNGELLNIKYLTPRKQTGEKNKWRQEADAEPCLFGWQSINENTRSVVICEGEIDCLSLAVLDIPALSIPAGANNMDWLIYDYESLSRFDDIVLMFDMDEAGQKNIAEIANRLGLERTRVAKLPMKDANEMLTSNRIGELLQSIDDAKHISPDELESAKNYFSDVSEIFNGTSPMLAGKTMPFEKAKGKIAFGTNQVTVWQGINGHGKSLFLGYVMIGLIEQGEKICIFSGEILPKMTLWRMACQLIGSQSPTQKWVDSAFDYMDEHLWIFNNLGNAKWERMINVFQYAAKRYGVTQFVIDSFACCGIAEDDYREQKKFIEALRTFKFEYAVHIHLVVHPRKSESEDRPPRKMDVKGTGAISDLVDNMITVFRVKKNEESKKNAQTPDEIGDTKDLPDVKLYCDKNRFGNWEGMLPLWFNQNNFQYYDSPRQHIRDWLPIEQGKHGGKQH